MADYGLRAPGVYIEEIAAVGPIQGVGTSTVAFIGEVVGLTAAGPNQTTTSTTPSTCLSTWR